LNPLEAPRNLGDCIASTHMCKLTKGCAAPAIKAFDVQVRCGGGVRARGSTVLVRDLIEHLQRQPLDATVVLLTYTTDGDPCVARLRDNEVRRMELGAWESNGVRVLELWDPELMLEGPVKAVVLGAS